MGQGSSHALGLTLGLPDRRVFVLDGDGALLMNLGTLVTIAHAAPKNLFHFVCENGTYEANGSHPLPNQGAIDFAGMARAAGFTHAYAFDDLETFTAALPEVLALAGTGVYHAQGRSGPGAGEIRRYLDARRRDARTFPEGDRRGVTPGKRLPLQSYAAYFFTLKP